MPLRSPNYGRRTRPPQRPGVFLTDARELPDGGWRVELHDDGGTLAFVAHDQSDGVRAVDLYKQGAFAARRPYLS